VPAYQLVLRLDPHDAQPNWLHDPAAPALRRSFYRSLGLRGTDTWVTLDPLAPKTADTFDRLEVLVKSGAVALGEVRLRESLTAEELEACEWFGLENRFFKAEPGYSVWDDYPACKSAAIPDGIHLFGDVVVSAMFRAVVEARRLGGLEFLRVKEKSRKPKLVWHVAVARAPLGQGVDHPWFDRTRWERYLRAHAATTYDQDAARPPGHFSGGWIRDEAYGAVPLLARLLKLLPEKSEQPLVGLTVLPVARYARAHLPATDFAYVPLGRDGPSRAGKLLRFRRLCASRRARDALLDAGLIRERDAEPLLVVDAPPTGAPDLDRLHPPPPPMYTDQELAALRAAEASLTRR
jgi:hypothetical protein